MPGFRRITWCVGALAVLLTGVEGQTAAGQVELGHRSAPVLRVDGLEFKDLNRNGRLDACEDWRLPPEARTTDLLKQMTVEEMAGVMVHGTLPTGGALGSIGRGDVGGYDLAKTRAAIEERHANSFITRLAGKASFIAEQNNAVQELAEGTRLGIPLTISTDPRHHFEEVLEASVGGKTFSQWPETLGFGAIGDERLMRRFGDVARQEYAAVGIREALSPQAGYFFGSRQHEGRLNFVESDKAYAEFLQVSAAVPTVLTTTLERPLILTNVKDHAAVLLGDFGLADEALMEVLTGKIKAEGKLPSELPSSVEAVEKQRSDLPHDSAAPLYKIGYGLRY